MTIVTGKLIGAAAPQRVEMKAILVDVTGKPAVGYVESVPGELVKDVPIVPDEEGDWTVTLTANPLIESVAGDTLWAIQEGRARDGSPIITYVAVPSTGGPFWVGNIRADLSTTITGAGTVVYLPGPQGDTGPAGVDGADGAPGASGPSAYEVAVTNGFEGTEAEWLASLVGPEGAEGPQGPQPALGVAGAGATIALKSNDPTTTNARTPTAHKTSHATGGTDALTATDIGAEAAGTATTAVSGHAAATDPHGDRAWASSTFATIVMHNTLTGTVTVLNGYLDDIFLRLAAIEQGTAFLEGLNVNGPAHVINNDLTVSDNTKGYRFRRGGDGLDLEATGADLIMSNWSGTGFNGTQRNYFRMSADAQNLQVAGKVEFVDGLYGATKHVLDGAANQAGFFGATPVGRPTVSGSWASGTAQASLAAALEQLGLINDETTA